MESSFMKILVDSAEEIGVPLSVQQAEQMEKLKNYLVAENEKFNLTGIKDETGIAIKHMADSLTLFRVPGVRDCGSFIDVGTGAGFPGLVMAVLMPETKATLLDSVGKKVKFVQNAALMLGLRNVKAITGRAEELAHLPEHREKYGLSVVRGVASISTAAEYCVPFLRKGGIFIAMKGPQAEEEMDDGKAALFSMGAKLTGINKVSLPQGQGERSLVYATKLSPTPGRFPRRTGEPQRRPITRMQE